MTRPPSVVKNALSIFNNYYRELPKRFFSDLIAFQLALFENSKPFAVLKEVN
jgi:hypothetical protein